jgi:hypothetical protein
VNDSGRHFFCYTVATLATVAAKRCATPPLDQLPDRKRVVLLKRDSHSPEFR